MDDICVNKPGATNLCRTQRSHCLRLMCQRRQTDSAPILLLLNFTTEEPMYRRQFDGIRRYADASGWTVVARSVAETTPADVPDLLATLRPIGCIDSCAKWRPGIPKRLFGKTPVCYIAPPGRIPWRSAITVNCNNAEIAAAALRELSLGLPSCLAVVPFRYPRAWSRARVATFQRLCGKRGFSCITFPDRFREDIASRAARLTAWASRLPEKCGIFAVNDPTADEVAVALRTAGRTMPRDATLVGADCLEGPADEPSTISSVRIDFEFSGYLAAKILAERIDGFRLIVTERTQKCNPPAFGPLLVERRESTGGRGRREPHVMEALDIIRREASAGLTAADVASRLPGSRNLLERRFREATGHSVFEEILQTRLQNAMSLLMRPELSVFAIADYSGFPSGNEFHRIFKTRFKMSPGQWRRSHVR